MLLELPYNILVLTSKGLSDAAFEELKALASEPEWASELSDLQNSYGGVTCRASAKGVGLLNFKLRSASRVLIKLVDGVRVSSKQEVYEAAQSAQIPLRWMTLQHTFSIDAVSLDAHNISQRYLAMVVKDAICDAFREETGGRRPSVEKQNPDVKVFVKLEGGRLFISLDSSGRPLHERGYRRETRHEAPLKEHLAAGLLTLSGWFAFSQHLRKHPDQKFEWSRIDSKSPLPEKKRKIPASVPFSGNFLDPMCGTGTLPIEAALMLCNRRLRKHAADFAFSKLVPFSSEEVLSQLRLLGDQLGREEFESSEVRERLQAYRESFFPSAEGESQEKPIVGSDHEKSFVLEAESCARAAGVSGVVHFQMKDFREATQACSGTQIVMNPPYDKRLQVGLPEGYRELGNSFKRLYPGSAAWVVSGDSQLLKTMGLRPTRRMPVYNGQIEARFCQYVMYR